MRARDLFGVLVRIFGFYSLAYALYYGLWIIYRLHGGEGSHYTTIGELEGDGLVDLIRGLLTLLLADLIVWLFYGLPPKSTSTILPGNDEHP
jgi:hypothetical protein